MLAEKSSQLRSEDSQSSWMAAAVVLLGFCWRLWLAHATFFNTDEAWHFSVANQDSLIAAYSASLTLAHPPLLVFILYFWRHLGTSDVVLRLPVVLAGSIFCWVFFKWLSLLFGRTVAWVGLILAAFLPPMIALSAELRQYSFMLLFAVAATCFVERALRDNSSGMMLLSSLSLYLAMLSHYSAFLFAASLGIYVIVRMVSNRPSNGVIAAWAAGQVVGVGLAGILFATHIAKLGSVYPVAQPLQRFGDFYLFDWYFHPGREHFATFLYRGTFGIFRFIFGQTAVGQVAALLFVAGVILLLSNGISKRSAALLLISPFVLNWIAVAAGLYPYGRTRHCIFLAIFALSGVALALVRVVRNRSVVAVGLALMVVVLCQAFGTLQGRDMLPLSEQRHEHMDQAIQLLRAQVLPGDVILTDHATSFQLRHYLCNDRPESIQPIADGGEWYQCDGFRVLCAGSPYEALTPENVAAQQTGLREFNRVWVVQGGWGKGLGEALRSQFPAFSAIEIHSFGLYLEIFQTPPPPQIT